MASKAHVVREAFEEMLKVMEVGRLSDGTVVGGVIVLNEDRLARRPGTTSGSSRRFLPADVATGLRTLRFGTQADTQVIYAAAETRTNGLSVQAVTGYIAKYATKDAESTDSTPRRIKDVADLDYLGASSARDSNDRLSAVRSSCVCAGPAGG